MLPKGVNDKKHFTAPDSPDLMKPDERSNISGEGKSIREGRSENRVQGNIMSRQIDKKPTFQIRVDRGYWKILSQIRTDYHMSFKELVEHAIAEMHAADDDGELEKVLGKKKDA